MTETSQEPDKERTRNQDLVAPALYPIDYDAEPTDHAFRGTRIIPYTL